MRVFWELWNKKHFHKLKKHETIAYIMHEEICWREQKHKWYIIVEMEMEKYDNEIYLETWTKYWIKDDKLQSSYKN